MIDIAKPESQPRTRKSAEQRREEILQAAVTLFARQGYERTTTRAIAQEAGIAEGTIYKYFASKHDLLFAFTDVTIISTLTALLQRLADADDATIVRTIIEDRFTMWERWQGVMKVVISEALYNDELALAFYQNVAGPGLGLLEEYLTRRIEQGIFRPMNVSIVARTFLGQMLIYFFLWKTLLGGQALGLSRRQVIDELTHQFLHGVCRPDVPVSEKPL